MKKRIGFVSNSSSSSFVILLPDNFDIRKHVEENWEKVDTRDYHEDLEDETEENKIKNYLEKCVKSFIDGDIDFYYEQHLIYILSELLHDYMIAGIESGPDQGDIILLDQYDKKKIRKILGC